MHDGPLISNVEHKVLYKGVAMSPPLLQAIANNCPVKNLVWLLHPKSSEGITRQAFWSIMCCLQSVRIRIIYPAEKEVAALIWLG